MNKRVLFAVLLGLAAAAAWPPYYCRAQSAPEDQSFNYNPGAGVKEPEIQRSLAETSYDDAEIVNHPVYGTIVLSKHRWKSWVARALYLTLINIALIAVIISIPKADEYSIIISYVLSGVSSAVSFWIFLCAVLLFRLNSSSWLYVLPIPVITWFISHVVLMKIKQSDISLTSLKESFQQMKSAASEDPRFVSVDGSPGDWPDQDFMK